MAFPIGGLPGWEHRMWRCPVCGTRVFPRRRSVYYDKSNSYPLGVACCGRYWYPGELVEDSLADLLEAVKEIEQ